MDETHKLAAIVAPISWICGLIGWLILFFTLNKSIRSAWSYIKNYIIYCYLCNDNNRSIYF